MSPTRPECLHVSTNGPRQARNASGRYFNPVLRSWVCYGCHPVGSGRAAYKVALDQLLADSRQTVQCLRDTGYDVSELVYSHCRRVWECSVSHGDVAGRVALYKSRPHNNWGWRLVIGGAPHRLPNLRREVAKEVALAVALCAFRSVVGGEDVSSRW